MIENSFMMDNINKSDISTHKLQVQGQPDQVTARLYLEQSVFPSVEKALNLLLDTIEKNGEFEKYVDMLAERQEREQKELRKRERERRRLEMGDEYVSSGSEDESEIEESDYDESVNSSEDNSSHLSFIDSEYINENGESPGRRQVKKSEYRSEMIDEGEVFNPLRFLGLALKDLIQQSSSYQ